MQLTDLHLPETVVMKNGVPLHIIDGGDNVVRLDLLFKGGYAVQKYPLQALFTNRMLREGSIGFSADEIAGKSDYYGAWIDMYSSQNYNHITLYTLSKHFGPMLDLVENFVKAPTFPSGNLDTVRMNNKAHYMVSSRKVEAVAQRYFEYYLWGESHPLGHIVTPEDYDRITKEMLCEYYSSVYGSRNCIIFLSGDCRKENITAIADRFGNEEWGRCKAIEIFDQPQNISIYGRHKVEIKGTMQSAVKVGCMTLDSSHPDFLKLRFLTVLFGGYFGSRLMSNIRETNGYTYHIQAELDAYGKRNAFMITSETDNEYVELLISEVYNEMQRLRHERITGEEVELVRNYTLGELCREYEGVLAKTDVYINALLSGEKFSTVNEYIDTVRRISAEELQYVAEKYINPGDMFEVIAGA